MVGRNLGAIILIIIAIKYLKRKPQEVKETIAPSLPPHVIANERLMEIKTKQVWKTGRIKQYHSDISETVRGYIEGRFDVNALEYTTNEIMQSLRYKTIAPEVLEKLNQILVLADLVKFAKELPVPDENIKSIELAIEFVEQTKLEITPPEEDND